MNDSSVTIPHNWELWPIEDDDGDEEDDEDL